MLPIGPLSGANNRLGRDVLRDVLKAAGNRSVSEAKGQQQEELTKNQETPNTERNELHHNASGDGIGDDSQQI